MVENIYSVYEHMNKKNGKRYIGLTMQKPKDRWKNGSSYGKDTIFYKAIKKYGWDNFEHTVLFTNLSKEEAEQKEIELIKKYKTTNHEFGYNIESGGNANKIVSKETRLKQSLARRGEKNIWYGKHLPKETCQKISNTKKGIRLGNALYNMKKVVQYDLDGSLIEVFDCMADAQNKTGIKYQNISMCCRNIIHKTHGYIFKYYNNIQDTKELDNQES